MNAMPCKLCGSTPVVKVREYHMCKDYLSEYYVICSFCGNEGTSAHSITEAIYNWNSENFKVKYCA